MLIFHIYHHRKKMLKYFINLSIDKHKSIESVWWWGISKITKVNSFLSIYVAPFVCCTDCFVPLESQCRVAVECVICLCFLSFWRYPRVACSLFDPSFSLRQHHLLLQTVCRHCHIRPIVVPLKCQFHFICHLENGVLRCSRVTRTY